MEFSIMRRTLIPIKKFHSVFLNTALKRKHVCEPWFSLIDVVFYSTWQLGNHEDGDDGDRD